MFQYTSILLLLFLIEACLGVAALLNKSSLESISEQTLNDMLTGFYDSKDKREFLDRVQTDVSNQSTDELVIGLFFNYHR